MFIEKAITSNRDMLTMLQRKPFRVQMGIFVWSIVLVALTIVIGSSRERQSVASPKLRYKTSWPLKFSSGKPTDTPILYCGDKASKGYYVENGNFTPQTASSDDLCDLIPTWYWISSPILSSLFVVFIVMQYAFQYIGLATPNGKKRLFVVIIALGARYVYWKISDEPAGAVFDSSDHILLNSVFIWALLWDATTSLIYYDNKRVRFMLWLWDAFWVIAFLVSLGFTAGIFHTADEMWAGWRDSIYFLTAAGLLATVVTKYEVILHRGQYQAVPMEEVIHLEGKGDDVEKQTLQF